MADLNRGRIALPPRHVEGNAFDIGGGNAWHDVAFAACRISDTARRFHREGSQRKCLRSNRSACCLICAASPTSAPTRPACIARPLAAGHRGAPMARRPHAARRGLSRRSTASATSSARAPRAAARSLIGLASRHPEPCAAGSTARWAASTRSRRRARSRRTGSGDTRRRRRRVLRRGRPFRQHSSAASSFTGLLKEDDIDKARHRDDGTPMRDGAEGRRL